jgi:beta-lactamase regulating signal transducer with metallopeptidase domain
MMSSFLVYILQVSILFSGFYLLYRFVFSRFTFHAFNRAFLLLLLPLSLLIPFTDELFPELPKFGMNIPLFEEFTAFSAISEASEVTANTQLNTIDTVFWIVFAYTIGAAIFLARFIHTNFRLFRLRNTSTAVQIANTTVYSANISEVCSYFQWIFIPKSTVNTIDSCIITHEKAHSKKLHSVDVLLTELFIVFSWFNPFAYWYRKSLKSIHEFQADAFVLAEKNVKKSSYLQVLLTSLEPSHKNPAFNYFSHPSLKKRIEMITKSPSKNSSKLWYVLLFPAIIFASMAFTKANEMVLPVKEISPITITTKGIPSLFPVQNGSLKNVSSKFGVVRKHPKLKNKTKHGGIDIKAPVGTPIVATANGTVLKAQDEGNWGNLIIIAHADGFETWYAHLKGFSIKTGANVQKGDVIGYVGNTGLSTAPHLHYEVRQHGKRLDPVDYITE